MRDADHAKALCDVVEFASAYVRDLKRAHEAQTHMANQLKEERDRTALARELQRRAEDRAAKAEEALRKVSALSTLETRGEA